MASADRPTLFINATVLDGSEHMEPQPDMAVAVERGVITWIGPSAVAQAPAGAEVIDLAGAYLMPGLINMHVHLCGSGKPVSAGDAGSLMKKLDNPVGRAIVRHILKGSAQQQLASGVTTVRGAGDPLFADIAVQRHRRRQVSGPASGGAGNGRYGAGRPWRRLVRAGSQYPCRGGRAGARPVCTRCRRHQVVRDGRRVRCDRGGRARRSCACRLMSLRRRVRRHTRLAFRLWPMSRALRA